MAQAPDLFVVCKSCGSEVSPYITECPYCGARLRKRAPKIEREPTLDEPRADTKRKPKPPKPRVPKARSGGLPGVRGERTARPYATIVLVALSLFGYLLLTVVERSDIAVVGQIDGEWWRVATSPFVYANVWYEVAAVLAIGLFGWLLERRHGPVAVLALFFLCGSGGIALTAAVDPSPLALGGNAAGLGLLCAWAVPDLLRRLRHQEYENDLLGALVIALVLLLMPLATPEASAIAGCAGAALGLLAGLALSRTRS